MRRSPLLPPRVSRFVLVAAALLRPPGVPSGPGVEDGYDLWLRYRPVADAARLAEYRATITELVVASDRATLRAARDELVRGVRGLLGRDVPVARSVSQDGALVVGTPANSPVVAALPLGAALRQVGPEGFVIRALPIRGRRAIVIAANRDVGVLYGAFQLLRLLQTERPLAGLDLASAPRLGLRLLDHWDNLNGTVERGYAGASLWEWARLPDSIDPRYSDYARANASVGINGVVLTNVNADALILTPAYLGKVAALARVFRPWGMKVYLTARFSAPIEIGGLATADPRDAGVRGWWAAKADEIYRAIPDFGGFLVKANSEGQPGPQDYHRTHADGANLLADAVAPHGGIVMWRAFVYSSAVPTDRVMQAADECVRMTFSNYPRVVGPVQAMMLVSREAVVNYMTPLGLAHQMARGHHYGPGPWVSGGRVDQTSVYFNRADSAGLGFDRTASGSNAVRQYALPVRNRFASRDSVPDDLLLWFHHVGWSERLRSGRTLWEELLRHYQAGVDTVRSMQRTWDGLEMEGLIDAERFHRVQALLRIQEAEARWWRDASVAYWQSFSLLPLLAGYEAPAHPLDWYMQLRCPPDPRKPRCDAVMGVP